MKFIILACLVLITLACEGNQFELTIDRVYGKYAYEERVYIYQGQISTENLITSITGVTGDNYTNKTVVACVAPGTIQVVLSDTAGDGWGYTDSQSYAIFKIGHSIISQRGIPYSSGTSLKEFKFSLYLDPVYLLGVSFKYTDSVQTDNSWKQPSYDDNNWLISIGGAFPSFTTSSIRYYRISTPLPLLTTFTALNINVYTNQGFIAYVNGVEIYRYKISATGELNTNSIGADSFAKLITFKKYLLTETTLNTISFEVHIANTAFNTQDIFDVSILRVGDGSTSSTSFGYPRINDFSVVSTPQASSNYYYPWKLVDFDTSTYWSVTSTDTADVTYTFPNEGAEYINCYSITTTSNIYAGYVREWYLYGSNDGTTWDYLDHQTPTGMDTTKIRKEFKIPYFIQSYKQYRFHFIGEADQKYSFSELELNVCEVPNLVATVSYPQNTIDGYSDITSVDLSCENSIYTSFTVTPAFPTSLTLDPLTGRIKGIASGSAGTHVYTITGTHRVTGDISQFTLTITLQLCLLPSFSHIYLNKINKSYAYEEQASILDNNDNTLFTFPDFSNNVNYETHLCIPTAPFKIFVNDTYNDGWSNGAFLEVYVNNGQQNLYVSSIKNYKYANAYYYFDPTFILYSYSSTWTYIQGQIPSDWYKITSSAAMSTYSYSAPPATTSNVWLFRNTFSVTSLDGFAALNINVYVCAGYVIYLNGEEVYRANIPTTGDLVMPIEASSTCTSSSYISISAATTYLNIGNNVIAIGIVNQSSSNPSTVLFDASILPLKQNDAGRISNVVVTSNTYSTNIAYINDFKVDSNWYMTVTGLTNQGTLTYKIDETRAEFFNEYCMTSSSSSIDYDPTNFYLEVSNDDTTYTTLSTVTGYTFEERKQKRCFYLTTNKKPWKYYRFVMTSSVKPSISSYSLYLSELNLFQMDFSTLVLPPLSYNTTTISGISSMEFPAMIPNSALYSNYEITPSLPSPLVLDTITGRIKGVCTGFMPATVYTISATSPLNVRSSTQVTIEIIYCSAPNVYFTVLIKTGTYGSEMGFTLTNRQGATVASGNSFTSSSTYSYPICDKADTYFFTVTDKYKDGWDSGYYKITLEDNSTALYGTLASGIASATYPLSIGYVIPPLRSEYKYLMGTATVPSLWNTISFDDSMWRTGLEGSFGQTQSVTTYFRNVFTIDYPTTYSDFSIAIKSRYGYIVYINGVEIYRNNMPSGTITSSTNCIKDLGDVIEEFNSFGFLSASLQLGKNVFAVEVHLPLGVQQVDLYFDSSLLVYTDSTYKGGDGIGSTELENDNTAYQLFDNNRNTVYYGSTRCEGAQFIYTASDHKKPFVNHYSLYSGTKCNKRHPSGWTLEGSNDGYIWTILHVAKNVMFTEYSQEKSFDFYNDKGYTIYRITVNECNNQMISESSSLETSCSYKEGATAGVQLADIAFFGVILQNYCKSEGDYIGAANGGSSFSPCPKYYTGYVEVFCVNSTFVNPTSYCVVDKVKYIEYISNILIVYQGNYVSFTPIVGGVEYTCESTSPLPNGLTIEGSTGIISGRVKDIFTAIEYTIMCSNKAGNATTTIILSSLENPASLWWVYLLLAIFALILIGLLIWCILNRSKSRKNAHVNLDKNRKNAKNAKNVDSKKTGVTENTKKSVRI